MEKKNNNKKKILIFVGAILAIALVVFGVYQFRQMQRQKNKEANEKAYEVMKEEVVKEPEDAEDESAEETDDSDIEVDFAKLQEMNPDIYAWIYIPDTVVSYPIVQSGGADQSYYLNHTAERTYGLPGSIYTENVNTKEFTDFNTIVYGHEMVDGSMFGGLKSYRDTAYWEEHPEIYVYTPEKKLTYRIFAAVVFPDRYIPEYYDFATIEGMGQYLTDIQTVQDVNSHVFEDATLDNHSKLLTLSTCISDQETNRYLVEAYLINEEEL